MSAHAERRIVLVVTGSSTAAYLPYWLNWIERERPEIRIRIVISEQGQRFVTSASLASAAVDSVCVDTWEAAEGHPLHLDLVRWAHAFVALPATLDYLSLFAAHSGARPSLLALQLTRAPIVFAPSLPPGALESSAASELWANVERRPEVTIVEPRAGVSRHDAELTAWVSAPMPDVLAAIRWPVHAETSSASKEMATGLLRTSVTPVGDSWRWLRSPGERAPRPFESVGDELALALDSLRGSGIVPSQNGRDGSRSYVVVDSRNVAERLITGDEVSEDVMARTGSALAALHATDLPDLDAAPSRGMNRLLDWLDGVDQSPLMRTVRAELDAAAPGIARGIRHDLRGLIDEEEPRLCHGAPGFGSVVSMEGQLQLMTGEDVHIGPRALDVAWPVGELLECAFTFPEQRDWDALLAAFLRGYGDSVNMPIAMLAQIRILLHMHDFFAYVGWSPHEFTRYASMLRYLETAREMS